MNHEWWEKPGCAIPFMLVMWPVMLWNWWVALVANEKE